MPKTREALLAFVESGVPLGLLEIGVVIIGPIKPYDSPISPVSCTIGGRSISSLLIPYG